MARRKGSETPLTSGPAFGLASVLQRARVDARISQQELAGKAGVSLASITKLETKNSPEPGFFMISSIARVLVESLDARDGRKLTQELQNLLFSDD